MKDYQSLIGKIIIAVAIVIAGVLIVMYLPLEIYRKLKK